MDIWSLARIEQVVHTSLVARIPGIGRDNNFPFQSIYHRFFPDTAPGGGGWRALSSDHGYLGDYHKKLSTSTPAMVKLIQDDLRTIFSYLQCVPATPKPTKDSNRATVWPVTINNKEELCIEFAVNPRYYRVGEIVPDQPSYSRKRKRNPRGHRAYGETFVELGRRRGIAYKTTAKMNQRVRWTLQAARKKENKEKTKQRGKIIAHEACEEEDDDLGTLEEEGDERITEEEEGTEDSDADEDMYSSDDDDAGRKNQRHKKHRQ